MGFAKVLILVLAASISCGAALAQPVWRGSDDLPTSPRACPGKKEEPPPPRAYDGGLPAGAPDRVGKPLVVVDVPRITGVGYFDATARGMKEAAAELGTVEVKTEGPTQISTSQQVGVIDDHVTAGVDGYVAARCAARLCPQGLRSPLGSGYRNHQYREQ